MSQNEAAGSLRIGRNAATVRASRLPQIAAARALRVGRSPRERTGIPSSMQAALRSRPFGISSSKTLIDSISSKSWRSRILIRGRTVGCTPRCARTQVNPPNSPYLQRLSAVFQIPKPTQNPAQARRIYGIGESSFPPSFPHRLLLTASVRLVR